ncbi:MAG: hypothetical protein H6707_19280 [Deltaproteobacteria bacterium]|nr:hypothetical protein [Deltaproteobacteria bacterium]
MSDDRPKRSWREIDQMRDGSRGGGQRERTQLDPRRQGTYRAKLDRLFSSGKIGDLVQERIGDAADDDPLRSKLLAAIASAEGRGPISKAVDAYLKEHPLPRDVDVLVKVLQHRDEDRQLEAIALLEEICAEEAPKRARSLIGQLKLIRDTGDDPELRQRAEALLEQLD